jgi:iron complex outermembrane receptor protein
MNMNSKVKTGVFLMTALAASIGATVAQAQSSEAITLEEVIITATKRETSLMDTGIAVSAFDASALKDLNITDSQDIAVNTPGVSVNKESVNIRGISRTSQNLGTEPGVGIYVNGVYTSEMQMLEASDFFDVGQVEVLRGPQGTLFGKSTVGGAVSIGHNRAHNEAEGRMRVDMGNDGVQTIQGMYNTALTDKISVRVTASEKRRDALQENSGGSDLESIDARYSSISLNAQWTEDFESNLRVEHLRSDQRPGSFFVDSYKTKTDIDAGDYATGVTGMSAWLGAPVVTSVNYPGGLDAGNGFAAIAPTNMVNPTATDLSKVRRDFASTEINEYTAATLVNEWVVGDYDVKFSAHYGESHYHRETDADGTVMEDQPLMQNPNVGTTFGSDYRYDLTRDMRVNSYELQFTSNFDGDFNYVAGANYHKTTAVDGGDGFYDANFDYTAINSGSFGGIEPTTGAPIALNGYSAQWSDTIFKTEAELEDISIAAFGQMTYDLSDELTLTLGARYTEVKKDGQDANYVAFTTGCTYTPIADPFGGAYGGPGYALNSTDCKPAPHAANQTWSETTWRAGLDWQFNDNSLLYASVTTGFKAGVIRLSENFSDDPALVDEVDPETITSYEIGYKADLLESRLRVAATIYHYSWEDMQVEVAQEVAGVNVTSYENAAKASATGFELEAMYLLTQNWTVAGSYSFIDSQYEEFDSIDTATCNNANFENFLTGVAVPASACALQDLSGNQLTGMSKNKYSLRSSYTVPTSVGDFVVDGSWTYVGPQFSDAANSSIREISGWHRADASVTWYSDNSDLSVRAYAKNLADNRELVTMGSPNSNDGGQTAYATLPRMYGVQVDYNF